MSKGFSKKFLWGAATSCYQIEGASAEDGRKDSIWDVFCRQPGKVVNGDTGDIADDHYHLWKEDIALMMRLSLKSYRFSFAWPRILPNGRGMPNPKGLAFYDRLIDELLQHNIQPMGTLYHWDLPQTLQETGGWFSRETADAFVEYAALAFKHFSDRVKLWITHNEPGVAAIAGYQLGFHAPGIVNPDGGVIAGHYMLLSHGMALQAMRALAPSRWKGKIGIALNISAVHPLHPDEKLDREAAKLHHDRGYGFFLEALYKGKYPPTVLEERPLLPEYIREGDLALISQPMDFLGINYYTRSVVGGKQKEEKVEVCPRKHVPNPHSVLWEFYPAGLGEVIEDIWKKYHPKEIMVTENGTALNDQPDASGEVHDPRRIDYLQAHLLEVKRSILKGIPITGYYAWSLLDNFEWAEGFSKRFGLVYVDYNTLKRTIKSSGQWYAGVASGVSEL